MRRFFCKPEYIYRPRQVISRLRFLLRPTTEKEVNVKILNQKISVSPLETIGKSLLHYGVYDLALTETLWRLTSSGDRVADIGANLGYFSLVFAHRVGAYGRVHCFEPHPQLQKKWQSHLRKTDSCVLHPVALSSKEGVMELYIPQDFEKNEGVASLEKIDHSKKIQVAVQTLDAALSGQQVRVIKMDVEGHELDVLLGAEGSLQFVDHVLFEDFKGSRSPVISHLRERGFTVYRLHKGLNRVHLLEVEASDDLPLWEPPNFLATKNVVEVKSRMKSRGWKCLSIL